MFFEWIRHFSRRDLPKTEKFIFSFVFGLFGTQTMTLSGCKTDSAILLHYERAYPTFPHYCFDRFYHHFHDFRLLSRVLELRSRVWSQNFVFYGSIMVWTTKHTLSNHKTRSKFEKFEITRIHIQFPSRGERIHGTRVPLIDLFNIFFLNVFSYFWRGPAPLRSPNFTIGIDVFGQDTRFLRPGQFFFRKFGFDQPSPLKLV